MPKAEKISLIISSICKEQNIPYESANPHLVTLMEDAVKLGKIYLQIKETLGIVKEIEERHNLQDLTAKFETLIYELDKADHLIIQLAREIKNDN
jgi:hypothetical protein